MNQSEPRNPLYLLLLLASVLFAVTAVAYAVVPVLEKMAAPDGMPPPSLLRARGGTWLLWELAAVAVLAIASMWLDHRQTLKREGPGGTIARHNDTGSNTSDR